MKRRVRYHSLARRDFVCIAEWSVRQWGKARTRRYLDEIEAQVQRIAENPTLGHDAELPRAALRRIATGRHVIFYLANEATVEIVRILHGAMDMEGRLR